MCPDVARGQPPRRWEVWLAPPEVRDRREWLRYRMALVTLQTALKCRTHAVLHRHGIVPGYSGLFGTAGRAFLNLLVAPNDETLRKSAKVTLKGYLQLLDRTRRQIARVTRKFRRQVVKSPAFSKAQARCLLDAPSADTVAGLRDRAILSVELQAGLRRAEIAALRIGDLHVNRGFDSLRVVRKGAKKDALAINPQTLLRLRAYLDASTHADDFDGAHFRPLRHNGRQRLPRRHMNPDAIDRYCEEIRARARPDPWLLGPLDAGYVHYNRPGERLQPGRHPTSRRPRRSVHDQALRP